MVTHDVAGNSRLATALAAIDAANAEEPSCLIYGQRMSAVLAELEPAPSDELAIAVRAQHIRRFEVPRDSYPAGLVGYKKWRAGLARFHAELAATIATTAGYSDEVAARVSSIIRKQRLESDPEAQTLEDVACIVFVRHHLADFASEHDPDKVVTIVAKTLAKMSERGRAVAAASDLAPDVRELIQRASAAVL